MTHTATSHGHGFLRRHACFRSSVPFLPFAPCFLPLVAIRWCFMRALSKVPPYQQHSTKHITRSHTMNALKNIEIAFVAAAVIAIGASTLEVSATSTVIAKAAELQMPVVTVSARRLSAAEKAALI